MRRRTILREPRRMHAAVGAVILAAPASAALADAPHGASAQPAANQTLRAHVHSHRLGYGQSVLVSGRAPASSAGQTVTLDYAPLGSTSWQQIDSARVGGNGGFRLSSPLRSSGRVRLTLAQAAGSPLPVAATAASTSTTPERVAVAAELRLRRRLRTVLGAGTVQVRGELLPHAAGQRVQLQARRAGRWVTLGSTRTGSRGRFAFRDRVSVPGQEPLRVRFAGDHSNAAVSSSAGRVAVLRQSMASWYQDGGNTACGFHAYYGVANLSLPCGTHVTFSSGGHTVTATVDDRGPYVGGREWDLNQNTAAALGFGGVGTVWSSS
jgi:rare lipoprotein A (RlpA)-like double-psi beta-barrel protein